MNIGEAIDVVMERVGELGLQRQPECYSVSEAVFILAGGKEKGLRAQRIPGKPQSHWFLRGPNDEIIDLTAGQFKKAPRYDRAVNAAFYPQTSRLAKALMV